MFLDEAGKEFRVVLHLALFSFQALNLLFYHVQCALWGSYKHREVSYLLITVFTQERLGAAFVCLGFFCSFCSPVFL